MNARLKTARLWAICLTVALGAGPAAAVERVDYRRNGEKKTAEGRIVVEAQDGGLLVQSSDGAIWTLPAEEILHREANEAAFAPLDKRRLAEQLLRELPEGFEVHDTQHYLICHNTSRVYAEWCGSLFEQLHRTFVNYWSQRGLKLRDCEFPLVAVVFANQGLFADHARGELGDATDNVIGYYSLQSNRMTMFDLTGLESLRGEGDRRNAAAQINEILSRPAAERTVATIIHEATHQLAFNCGLHARYADVPLWVSEGMAVFFEAPDFSNKKGWRKVGEVNRVRYAGFRDYLSRRQPGSLKSLVAEDQRFRAAQDANDAYSEAWALNYFLIRQRSKQYVAYLKKLAEKTPLAFDEPAERLQAFEEAFGSDYDKLDVDFLKFLGKVRL